jgi:hypothetical protein
VAKYTVNFETHISVTVDIEAEDADLAGEAAWPLAEDYLKTVGGNHRNVRAYATLDGLGAESVEKTNR